ncbi:uncharacterized protein [Anabrus simplex]|uniref:uncharacterized protein n=1 Tax=Anabrus simplex TaxID=316456 RepID=UPI0035A2A3DD
MEEKIIEAVRSYPILYDVNHVDYVKTKLKLYIWSEIAKDVNVNNGNEAKSIWTKLRSCHRDALRRRHKYLTSGAAAEILKEWKFQKQMEFLLPYTVNRKRVVNLHDSDDEESQAQCENVDEDIEDMEAAIADEDGEMQNDDTDLEDVTDKNENSAESEKDISESAVKKLILKQSRKKIAKLDMSSVLHRSITERERRARERESSRTSKIARYETFR